MINAVLKEKFLTIKTQEDYLNRNQYKFSKSCK
jgi:hypothetical protein